MIWFYLLFVMSNKEATELILHAFKPGKKSIWADFGCGAGVFTNALAGLLEAGSKIYAVDKRKQQIESLSKDVLIEFIQSDFEKEPIVLINLDGIIMANSLHYIKDQHHFILRIKDALKQNGRIILIEYDTEQSNQWVPYPVSLTKANQLFKACGFTVVTKIGERQSIYRSDKMYACLIAQG